MYRMSPTPEEGFENEIPFLAYSDRAGLGEGGKEGKKEDQPDEREQILDAIGSNYYWQKISIMLHCCVQSGESTSSTAVL